MANLVCTVPGAIESLLTHFDTVASNNWALNPLVVYGEPVGSQESDTYNLLQVTGVHQLQRAWRTLGALGTSGANPSASEDYSIECLVRCWVGDATQRANKLTALTNAYGLVDDIVIELFNDPQAAGALTGSGSWSLGTVDKVQGVLKGGWNVDLTFGVLVENVRVTWL